MKLGPKEPGKAQLSTEQRAAIVYAYKVKLAADFGCTRKTIYNTLKRYSINEQLENRSPASVLDV
ncbi:uncharacterized protein N7511_005109 [Penicillium nucicola]|uniref:uncharacterized protein n=1 Tax=Penicillium nucicola TaxID=1850975 RepID=UPI002544F596|nr:uncharacterized protein N7511_005109 [Penicillium nucicola]KAJ5761727.1 hypothetical protein N7511_005109 [Penicillium nucicola]